jgi:hypothetical protein
MTCEDLPKWLSDLNFTYSLPFFLLEQIHRQEVSSRRKYLEGTPFCFYSNQHYWVLHPSTMVICPCGMCQKYLIWVIYMFWNAVSFSKEEAWLVCGIYRASQRWVVCSMELHHSIRIYVYGVITFHMMTVQMTNSSCTFQNDPSSDQRGPFCASSCNWCN